MSFEIRQGDVLKRLAEMPDASVNCVVTNPPYFNLRDYGNARQIGLEKTPEEYVGRIVSVFREVRRVLADDGTLWLNLGDCYSATTKGSGGQTKKQASNAGSFFSKRTNRIGPGLKPKDLVGIPWRVAFALQADGWWLRSEIIWAKPNPMPESVTDRPTKSHEQIFLLTKSARYFYDADAIKRDGSLQKSSNTQHKYVNGQQIHAYKSGFLKMRGKVYPKVNARTVWTITPRPFKGAHFATFPPELPETCIKAGCPPGGVVLDPFAGAGTTLLAAEKLGRIGIGIELNAAYCAMARARFGAVPPAKARAA